MSRAGIVAPIANPATAGADRQHGDRQRREGEDEAQRRRDRQPDPDHQFMPRKPVGDNAAGQHAERRRDQKARQHRVRGADRHAERRHRRGRKERLQPDLGDRQQA